MAYSETLADRIHALLADRVDVTQRKMFGGLAFMVGGHMACGVVGDELMLRLGEEGADAALGEQHVRPMDFTGRPMRTMVFVEPAGISQEADLGRWINRAVQHAKSLPPK
jgi:TfoX/Sxy family transcriptional regulator of competence genes